MGLIADGSFVNAKCEALHWMAVAFTCFRYEGFVGCNDDGTDKLVVGIGDKVMHCRLVP